MSSKLVGASERILALNVTSADGRSISAAFLRGLQGEPDHDMIADALGELVNIVAGQVKSAAAGTAGAFEIGIPSVVVGQGHEIRHQADMPASFARMHSPIGSFTLHLCTRLRE